MANMEDVLEVYQRPYDPTIPQICMDEQPVQLIKETRGPLPRAPGKPERYDYEYERNGTANIFMFSQPVAGQARCRWESTLEHGVRHRRSERYGSYCEVYI